MGEGRKNRVGPMQDDEQEEQQARNQKNPGPTSVTINNAFWALVSSTIMPRVIMARHSSQEQCGQKINHKIFTEVHGATQVQASQGSLDHKERGPDQLAQLVLV